MNKSTKETLEERLNPPLDSPWNKMAVPTTDTLYEVLLELIEHEIIQQKKEKEQDHGLFTKTL